MTFIDSLLQLFQLLFIIVVLLQCYLSLAKEVFPDVTRGQLERPMPGQAIEAHIN